MYAKIINNEVVKCPYTLLDLQQDNPNTSFSEVLTESVLASYNVVTVVETAPPEIDHKTQQLYFVIQNIEGKWVQVWNAQNLLQDQAESNVRGYRDELLSESDWTQVADAPVDQAAWATYRQALRDIPQQAGFPWNVEWPSKPE
jgi:hypothetical protein